MPPPLLGTLLASGAAIALGSLFPVAAGIFQHVDALHTTTLRYLMAAALLLAILAKVEGRRALRFDGRMWQIIGLGIIGIAGVNLLSFIGLARSTPQNTALIVSLQPCIAVVVMWLRTRRAPTPAKLGVTLLALLGVALVITKGSIGGAIAGGIGAGEGLVLIAALLWVLYSIGATTLTGWSPLRYTALTSTVGAVVMAVITQGITLAGGARTPALSNLAAATVPLLYIAVVCGVGAILAWNASMKLLGPSNAVLFSSLIPITALTIQIVRGYRPGLVEIAGAVTAVIALIASSLLDRRAARTTAAIPPTLSPHPGQSDRALRGTSSSPSPRLSRGPSMTTSTSASIGTATDAGSPLRTLFAFHVTQDFFSTAPDEWPAIATTLRTAFDDLAGRYGAHVLGTLDDDQLTVGAATAGSPATAYVLADVPDLHTVKQICNILREQTHGPHLLCTFLRVEARIGRPLFFATR